MEEPASVTVVLYRLNELRIRISPLEPAEFESNLRVAGHRDNESLVEVNGAPLCPGTRYQLRPGSSHTIVCWSPTATLYLECSATALRNMYRCPTSAIAYPLGEYHCILNELRGTSNPPRVLVCGRDDSGKTDVAMTLANYAARFGWSPMLVDLDPSSRQCVSLPGSIGACVVEYPLAMDEELVSHHLSVHYFVGSIDPQPSNKPEAATSPVWTHFAKTLCEVSLKPACDQTLMSGTIVVAPELRGSDVCNVLNSIVEASSITHILCLGDEWTFEKLFAHYRLHSDILPTATNQFVLRSGRTICIDEIGGVATAMVPTSRRSALSLCQLRFSAYFHGIGAGRINSFMFEKLPLTTTAIYRFVTKDGKVSAVLVERSQLENIVNCIAAIVDPAQARRDLGGFLSCPVCGFARIHSADGQDISLLTNLAKSSFPSGKLTLIVGDVQMLV